MNPWLEDFFARMQPFLLGASSVEAVEDALGPSPSGTESLDFYRVLLERNYFKIMKGLFPTIRTVALSIDEALWGHLVRDYVREHPTRGCRDPNLMGAGFSDWLARRREDPAAQGAKYPPLLEELAEYHWIDYMAGVAPDTDDDGFEKRIFVRQFSYHMPKAVKRLRKVEADAAEVKLPKPKPTVLVLYRSSLDDKVKVLFPTNETLAVFARRQGLELPPPLAQLDSEAVGATESSLVDMGVLRRPRDETETPC